MSKEGQPGICKSCGNPSFYRRSWGWKCKYCVNKEGRIWAKERREKGLPTGGKCSAEWWAQYRGQYYSKPENRKRQTENMKGYREDPVLKERMDARDAVNKAVKSGRLIKTPCVDCGSTKRIEGHHPDYSKPLDVIWLCWKCHIERHVLERLFEK